MFIKYSGSDFPILISKINDLISTKSDDYSTANLSDALPMKDLLLNLKIVVNLDQSDDLKILDNSNLAFHKRLSQDLDYSIKDKIVAFFNSNDIRTTDDDTIQALNLMFFADFYEYTLFHSNPIRMHDFNSFVRTVIQNFQFFTSDNFICLTRLLSIIPSLGFREIISSEDFKSIKLIQDTESKIAESLKKAENLKKEVNLLDEKLAKQKTEFNFIGLSDGFNSLRKQKVKELNGERGVYWILMLSIIGLIIYKLYWTVNYLNEPNPNLQLLIVVSISFVLMLLVVIYFFRISLVNIKSIRSQILQIDLRLTLCQFIHNYQNDTSGFRNAEIKDSLDKFEAVIFSPIVATDDKIPTTFEGIEQLSGLIGLVKGKTP